MPQHRNLKKHLTNCHIYKERNTDFKLYNLGKTYCRYEDELLTLPSFQTQQLGTVVNIEKNNYRKTSLKVLKSQNTISFVEHYVLGALEQTSIKRKF